jgi:MFS transporter, ACS family, tartrate transporter
MIPLADTSVPPLERQTLLRIWRRTVPLLVAVLLCSYLDRVNIGFAAVQMNQALGFSNGVFGTAAGCFALGYVLFGIPSTLLLHRVGARRWISLIVILWGTASAATAFVTSAQQLAIARCLLGLAEAGFAPGAILYFSYWFPSEYRGRVMGSFAFIQPVALILGGPASSSLLSLDGDLRLAGWQWLLLVEASPALLLAVLVFRYLPDRPDAATWLPSANREWLAARLAAEQRRIDATGSVTSAWGVLRSGRVWALAVVALAFSTSGGGTVFFMPLIIRSMGFSVSHTGLIAALPGIVCTLAVPLWGMWADRANRREGVVAVAALVIAVGLAGTAVALPSPWALVPMCLAMTGYFGFVAAFWTLPSMFLSGARAAAGISFINIMANLGNFTGPALLGQIYDLSRSYAIGLCCLAAIAAVAALMMGVPVLRNWRPQQGTAPDSLTQVAAEHRPAHRQDTGRSPC